MSYRGTTSCLAVLLTRNDTGKCAEMLRLLQIWNSFLMETLQKSVFFLSYYFGAYILTHYEDRREGNQCVLLSSMAQL
jgi:hypothetical protein